MKIKSINGVTRRRGTTIAAAALSVALVTPFVHPVVNPGPRRLLLLRMQHLRRIAVLTRRVLRKRLQFERMVLGVRRRATKVGSIWIVIKRQMTRMMLTRLCLV